MSPKTKKLRKLARKLRAKMQPCFPIKIELVDVKGKGRAHSWMGQARLVLPDDGAPYFRVQINKSLDWVSTSDTLVHEFAHCLSWTSDAPEIDEHDDTWGMWYARCYRAAVA